jgi:hypothetical protein
MEFAEVEEEDEGGDEEANEDEGEKGKGFEVDKVVDVGEVDGKEKEGSGS